MAAKHVVVFAGRDIVFGDKMEVSGYFIVESDDMEEVKREAARRVENQDLDEVEYDIVDIDCKYLSHEDGTNYL